MLGWDFYHKSLRKYVVLFGTLFNDLVVDRVDSAGNIVGQVQVPIAYGPKEKVLARLVADPNLDRPFAIELPRMMFEIIGMSYDGARKLTSTGRNRIVDQDTHMAKYQYNPVPYNIQFRLDVIVKNTEDATRIMEQILPFFTPQWVVSAVLIPEMDSDTRDIPVVLNSVHVQDDYAEGKIADRRTQIWSLVFTVKGFLFGPVTTSGVIKLANTNFYVANLDSTGEIITANQHYSDETTITPGQTANGQATTNSALAIDYHLVEANTDWAYIIRNTSNTSAG